VTFAHWSAVCAQPHVQRSDPKDHYWADWEAAKRSYELMARHVHPRFQRQSNLQHVASYDDTKVKRATAGVESQRAANAEIERYNQGKEQADRCQGVVRRSKLRGDTCKDHCSCSSSHVLH
jgi:hypothetical protein